MIETPSQTPQKQRGVTAAETAHGPVRDQVAERDRTVCAGCRGRRPAATTRLLCVVGARPCAQRRRRSLPRRADWSAPEDRPGTGVVLEEHLDALAPQARLLPHHPPANAVPDMTVTRFTLGKVRQTGRVNREDRASALDRDDSTSARAARAQLQVGAAFKFFGSQSASAHSSGTSGPTGTKSCSKPVSRLVPGYPKLSPDFMPQEQPGSSWRRSPAQSDGSPSSSRKTSPAASLACSGHLLV